MKMEIKTRPPDRQVEHEEWLMEVKLQSVNINMFVLSSSRLRVNEPQKPQKKSFSPERLRKLNESFKAVSLIQVWREWPAVTRCGHRWRQTSESLHWTHFFTLWSIITFFLKLVQLFASVATALILMVALLERWHLASMIWLTWWWRYATFKRRSSDVTGNIIIN